MKLKLLFLSALISCSLYAQTNNESIQLVYDTSGYLENNPVPESFVAAPVDPGDQQAISFIPTVSAEMSISESGALTYMVPIETLQGLNNFQPNLALVYSSQSGNGQAGYGWNITGTSMISKGGKSKEIDGITIGAQFDNTDPFYLDGQRLIKINDTDYVTEKFSKIKIQKFSSGEYSFIVKYTDGRIAKYKEIVPDSGQYYISVFLDSFNNEIHYSYAVVTNTPYLTAVSYGGTDVGTDKFSINIYYKNRVSVLKIYRRGKEFANSKIIDYITTSSSYSDVGLYRKYNLLYDYIENNTIDRLRRITVSNKNGEALKPVNFAYNSTADAGQIDYLDKSSIAVPSGTKGLGSVALGDFFGKGEVEPIYQIKNSNNTFSLFNSTGKLNTTVGTRGNDDFFAGKVLINNKISKNDQLITASTNFLGSISTDNDSNNPINGSLIDRVTFYINDLVSNVSRQVVVDLVGSTSYYVTHDPYDDWNGSGGSGTQTLERDTTEREFISGDFNNDGLIDFLIYEPSGLNRPGQLYIVEVGKGQSGAVPSKILGPLNENYIMEPNLIEFDGDGIPEVMIVSKYYAKYSIYKIDLATKVNGNDYNSKTIIANQTLDNYGSTTPLFFGDFNGDGLTDFMIPHKIYKMQDQDKALTRLYYSIQQEQQYWNKYISKGTFFEKSVEDLTEQHIAYIESNQRNIIKRSSFWQKLWSGKMDEYTHTEYSTNTIIVTDFNGDGRSDIIMVNKIGTIKYSPDGDLRKASINNLSTTLELPIWPYSFNSPIANKITYIKNVYGDSTGNTFQKFFNPTKPIENTSYSPMTLIAPTAKLNQLNQYKSGVMLLDVLKNGYGSWVVNSDNFSEKQIQAVDNGSGVIQKIEYRALAPSYTTSEAPYYYNKEEADRFQYPLYIHNVNSGMQLAHKLHTEFDGKILTKEYRFENGVQNLDGRGFIGFQKTYVSDTYQSEIKEGKYVNKNPLKAVFWNITTKDPLKENVTLSSSYGGLKDFLTFNRFISEKIDRGNHQYLILSTEETSIDYLKKITINKRYDYDKNDELKLKKVYTDYNNDGTTVAEYTYKPESFNGDHYFYGKIASTKQSTFKDNLSFSTREEMEYFPNGNIQENRQFGNDPAAAAIVTTYTYDDIGNGKTKTIYTNGFASQTTTFIYDATKRYISKTTTPEGLFSELLVDTFGRVKEETSSLGLKTYYQYDSWGNVSKITDHLGKQTTITKTTATSPDGASYTISKKRQGDVMTVITFDKFDREIQSRTQSLNNKWKVIQTQYDIFGRKEKYSEPYFLGDSPKWNSVEYDELSRPIKNISFTGKVINSCYEGLKVTVYDDYKITSKTLDAMGNTIRHQDHGGVISYTYYPNGAPRSTNYEGIKTTFEIDGWGNKTKITDPSAGVFTYEFDNLSRIKKETTPKGYTLFTYDDFDRPLTEKIYGISSSENTTIEKNYYYDDTQTGKFLPKQVTGTSNGKSFSYTTLYDEYYRIKGKIEQTPDFTYTTNTTFDSFGRADVLTTTAVINNPNFTTTSSVKNVYDANGILIRQNDNLTGKKIWQINTANANGKTTEMEYGNGYLVKNIYRDTDNTLTDIRHIGSDGVSIVDIGYDYDPNKGVLNSRNNRTFGIYEKYTYDKLNRLLTEMVDNVVVNEYTYDQRGRMTSNAQLGQYNYNSTDYKLQSINFNTKGQNVNSHRGFANITYNAYKSPLNINLPGKDNLSFEYNILKSRYSMASSVTGKQKFYSSDFVLEISKSGNKTEVITFLTGDPYTSNFVKKETLVNGSLTESGKFFLHRDYQGSILAITKESDGVVVEKRYFDAWGNLKAMTNAQQQFITNNPQMLFIDRGYTGHEHLQSIGLINMNARIYDPIVRKFLSADNFVSDSYNTQAYDRYSYVLNNPLLYMDLDGNEAITLGVAVVIGVVLAITSKAIINMIQGIPFWYGLGKAATMGAVTSVISFGIGSVATSTFGTALTAGKAAFEAGLHAVTSGALSALDGGKFGSGFLTGMVSSLISSGMQGIGQSGTKVDGLNMSSIGGMQMILPEFSNFASRNSGLFQAMMLTSGGLAGGLSSTIAGGKFIDGFKQGLMISGLNHLAHMVTRPGQTTNSQQSEDGPNDATVLNPDASQSGGAKALRILSSFVAYDSSKTFLGKAVQVLSHFTWELPQQLFGLIVGEVTNLIGGIESVFRYSNGAIVLDNKWMGNEAGLTSGNIITVASGSSSNTLSHEFGHYIQSRQFGPLWAPVFGIPSIVRATIWTAFPGNDYFKFYTEKSATSLGNKYSGW